MPQFFFFDLLLISSVSSPGALADYHSLHLLSGSNGSRKEKRGSGRGRAQGEVLGPGGSAELLTFTALRGMLQDAVRCTVLRDALQHPCTRELPMAFHQPLPFLSPLRIPPSASETQLSSSCYALGPKQMPFALQGSRCSLRWDLGGREGGWPY